MGTYRSNITGLASAWKKYFGSWAGGAGLLPSSTAVVITEDEWNDWPDKVLKIKQW
jgi:hypothetical protein